jgi:hypothetical protein
VEEDKGLGPLVTMKTDECVEEVLFMKENTTVQTMKFKF